MVKHRWKPVASKVRAWARFRCKVCRMYVTIDRMVGWTIDQHLSRERLPTDCDQVLARFVLDM